MHLALPLSALVAASFVLAGCGANIQPPSEHLVNADASIRAAQQLGANKTSKSAQRLAAAQASIEAAKAAMKEGRHAEAESLLVRADAEAELAATLSKEEVLDAEIARLKARVAQEESKK